MPAVRLVALQDVLGEGRLGVALDRDVVVVVQRDQVAQLLVAGQRGGLGGDALLQVAVGDDRPDGVVERRGARSSPGVEEPALVARGHRHAHGVGDALAERAGGGLHAGRVPVLGVTRRTAARDPEGLQVVQLQAVARQVQLGVERQAGVPGGEDEAVASHPGRVGRVVAQEALEDQVRRGGQRHGRPRVSVADLLYCVHGQDTGRVDRTLVQLGPLECVRRRGAHPSLRAPSVLKSDPVKGTGSATSLWARRIGWCRSRRVDPASLCEPTVWPGAHPQCWGNLGPRVVVPGRADRAFVQTRPFSGGLPPHRT